jgi:hypothetical protein
MFRGGIYNGGYINSVLNIGLVGRRNNKEYALCFVSFLVFFFRYWHKKSPSVLLKDLYKCSYTTPFSRKMNYGSKYVLYCSQGNIREMGINYQKNLSAPATSNSKCQTKTIITYSKSM